MKNTKRIMLLVKRAKRRVERIEKLIRAGRIACSGEKIDAFEQSCRLGDDADEIATAIIDFKEATDGKH